MTANLSEKSVTSSQILLYKTEDGHSCIEVRLENETVWLSQKLLAELFQKDVCTINEHIKNIYTEGELEPEATIRKFQIVKTEGKRQVSRSRVWRSFAKQNRVFLETGFDRTVFSIS